MKLYHGSNMEVARPKILERLRALDFGAGFYLTSSYEQAVEKLLPQKLTDQYAFLTDASLKALSFGGSEMI
jgi:hypothetical protein